MVRMRFKIKDWWKYGCERGSQTEGAAIAGAGSVAVNKFFLVRVRLKIKTVIQL